LVSVDIVVAIQMPKSEELGKVWGGHSIMLLVSRLSHSL